MLLKLHIFNILIDLQQALSENLKLPKQTSNPVVLNVIKSTAAENEDNVEVQIIMQSTASASKNNTAGQPKIVYATKQFLD